MNRRNLVALPGIAALVAARGFSETRETAAVGDGTVHVSRKALSKHSGMKSSYKIPKTANKQTRYVNTLTALLSLTSGQQEQVASIYSAAATAGAPIGAGLKAARKTLNAAVKNNDTNAIAQAAASLGALTGQHIANGAKANAAIFQVLTSDQQAKLSQVQG